MRTRQTARVYRVKANGDRQVMPETRRGTTAVSSAQGASQALNQTMSHMESDEHFHAIAKRIEKFTAKTNADLDVLKEAIATGDSDAVNETARRLTDHTGRMGAMKMMRLCIALQMLARREMIEKAKDIAADLEKEFSQLKQTWVKAS